MTASLHRASLISLTVWLSALGVSCKDKDPGTGKAPGGGGDSVADTGGEGVRADTLCADLGLTVRPFTAGGAEGDFGQLVPDFTWSTTAGDWTFSEEWTGCDSYILLNFNVDTNYPELDDARAWVSWLESSPRNVHYFIIPFSSDVEGVLSATQATFAEALDDLDAELAAHWADRMHFVLDNAYEAAWAGPLNSRYTSSLGGYRQSALAIDRFQIAREVGSFCDPSDGWQTCPPDFISQEAVYFNFESDRADRLAAMGETTVIPVFERTPGQDPGWAGERIFAEVSLPDAATMAGFDTLELDLNLECRGYPAATECPPWDYLVHAYLCDADDPETIEVDESQTCTTELGRWITTYWRPGRWVHDVTPFLALLQEGGTRRIAFYTQQYYDVSLSLRLSNQGKGVRPVAMQPLFSGGSFWDRYNWGVTHTVTDTTWTLGSHSSDTDSHTIVSQDLEARVLVTSEGGGWHRFAWTAPEGGTMRLCRTSGYADADAARDALGAEDPADLEAGCGGGAWATLTRPEGGDKAGLAGEWLEIWSADKLPVRFVPPEDTRKVEVMAVISGHGFGDNGPNCAEFCDHQHRFTLNGAGSHTKTHPEAGTATGCVTQVADGTVPNQSGTWVYGRGGWCPGMEVDLWRADVTADVTLGAENEVSYLGLLRGAIWQPGAPTSARIDMVSYLVFYE